mmetsp:Transcript_60645/g.130161  ORF Transcript_60645/g.130161 Transcript_60645/m.130161 type:complete len:306 (+) Transcript_60645:88-1005(+)
MRLQHVLAVWLALVLQACFAFQNARNAQGVSFSNSYIASRGARTFRSELASPRNDNDADMHDQGAQEGQPNIMMLYTTSGADRHMESFCINMDLLARPDTPHVLQSAAILIYDNHETADGDEGLLRYSQLPTTGRVSKYRDCLGKVSNTRKMLYMSAQNVGYTMGAVQAMDILEKAQLLEGYDWVIHQHPDVFLIHPDKVVDSLRTSLPAIGDEIYDACWRFDWFAFRPNQIDHDAFDKYGTYGGGPECYLRDNVFKDMRVKVLGRGSSHQHGPIDEAGLWHSHDPDCVRRSLNMNSSLASAWCI